MEMTEDRKQIWDDYIAQGGMHHRIVKHMFTEYQRYHEAGLIEKALALQHIDLKNLKILDYGCGVGDYGIYLLRAGAKQADFYDFPRSTQLVSYRLETEGLTNWKVIDADKDEHPNFLDYDLIIFGEVLEHLEDPRMILTMCVGCQVDYVFTSSYPYRSEDPEDPYWSNHDHDDKARLQIPHCKRLLEDNYTYTKFDGELRLWSRIRMQPR